jgi:hypothetical protein
MPSRWTAVLAPGTTSRQEFDKLLVQRVEQEFEPEEEIISCVLTALLEVADVKALTAELDEVFDDQAGVISEWCVWLGAKRFACFCCSMATEPTRSAAQPSPTQCFAHYSSAAGAGRPSVS